MNRNIKITIFASHPLRESLACVCIGVVVEKVELLVKVTNAGWGICENTQDMKDFPKHAFGMHSVMYEPV